MKKSLILCITMVFLLLVSNASALTAYSDAFRQLIPMQSAHPFRFIAAGHSDPFRPPLNG
jgi:hypothetical protein